VQLFSVYERAANHPDCCAVRRVLVADDGLAPAGWQLFRSLQEARAALARRGLTRVPRGEQDEPGLVETWL
jgi:hypothetical protein